MDGIPAVYVLYLDGAAMKTLWEEESQEFIYLWIMEKEMVQESLNQSADTSRGGGGILTRLALDLGERHFRGQISKMDTVRVVLAAQSLCQILLWMRVLPPLIRGEALQIRIAQPTLGVIMGILNAFEGRYEDMWGIGRNIMLDCFSGRMEPCGLRGKCLPGMFMDSGGV